MLLEEVEGLLLGGVSLQQLADGLQPPGPVGEGRLRRPARWPWRRAASSRPTAPATPARPRFPGFEACFRPSGRCARRVAEPRPSRYTAPRSTPLRFWLVDVFRQRAEAARLLPHMHAHLLHAVVEDPHQPQVPPHPQRVAQVLRRHRVICLGHLDVPVPMHDPLPLMEEREPLQRQRLQRPPLHFLEELADLLADRAVNAGVGHRGFPVREDARSLSPGS